MYGCVALPGPTEYRRVSGSLQDSPPDSLHVAQFIVNLCKLHHAAAKIILCYIKGALNCRVEFPPSKNSLNSPRIGMDAPWCSTSGYCVFFKDSILFLGI